MKFAQIAKRIGFFLLVNILVMLTVGIVTNLLFSRYARLLGGTQQLFIYCFIWGMAGAFISLAFSRFAAKFFRGVQVIDPNTTDPNLRQLVQTVHQLAKTAGLSTMPEVGVYDSPEINAFATGPSRSMSLVAVSSGLLSRMRQYEIEGVLGHEITHIANGDMVTLTLIQGVVNSFAFFLSIVLASALTRGSDRDDDRGGNWMMRGILEEVFQVIFMLLGSLVVMWFSRWREFRADAGGARIAGRDHMLSALRALKQVHEAGADVFAPQQQASVQALKISGKTGGLIALFASHPPLEERIARLESLPPFEEPGLAGVPVY